MDGAPNFRQVEGLPVYGVAVPTVQGVRNVLNVVQGGKERPVVWHSMREEPLVYVNGQPYVLREVERPFSNLELTGITCKRVEQMEARLRQDVLAEAEQYGGRVLVSRELEDGQVVDVFVPLRSVQTPREVYSDLVSEGYHSLLYVRIPITDEKAPKGSDCDAIASRCIAADESTALIFNCQMGRGRTTTAMVIASLVRQRLRGSPLLLPPLPARPAPLEDEDAPFRRGDYAVIRSLVRVVDGGKEAKQVVDEMIDRCSHLQNLREAILTYRRGLGQEVDEKHREATLQRGVEYLCAPPCQEVGDRVLLLTDSPCRERYWTLCAFASYVQDPQWVAASESDGSFQLWMNRRPELQSVLRRMLWRSPMAALTTTLTPAASAALSALSESDAAADAVVANRSGAVLGASSILKARPVSRGFDSG